MFIEKIIPRKIKLGVCVICIEMENIKRVNIIREGIDILRIIWK